MKFALISLVALTLTSAGVLASQCTCADTDTQCWAKCVTDTNNCISNCQGDITCYQNCINQGWPGISASSSAAISPTAVTSSSAEPTVIESSTAVPTSLETSSTQAASAIPSDIQSSLSQILSSTSPSATTSALPMPSNIQSSLSQILSSALSSTAAESSAPLVVPTASSQVPSHAIPSVLSSLVAHASSIAAASASESASTTSESESATMSSAASTSATSTPEPTSNSAAAVYIPSNAITTLVAVSLALICLY